MDALDGDQADGADEGGGHDHQQPARRGENLGVEREHDDPGEGQRDTEPAAPADALAQQQDREQRCERHAELARDRHRGHVPGQLHAGEHQRELQPAAADRGGQQPFHLAAADTEPRQDREAHDQEAQEAQEHRRKAVHRELDRDDVESPDAVDQHQLPEMRARDLRCGHKTSSSAGGRRL